MFLLALDKEQQEHVKIKFTVVIAPLVHLFDNFTLL